jgi:TPR repeat protein
MSNEHQEEHGFRAAIAGRIGPCEIGGWLAFFCFQLSVLGPLFSLGTISSALDAAGKIAPTYPQLAAAIRVASYGDAAIQLYGFAAGTAIWSGISSGRKIAKRFLLISFLGYLFLGIISLGMLPTTMPSNLTSTFSDNSVKTISYSAIYSFVWWLYFVKSMRIRNTYGDEAIASNVGRDVQPLANERVDTAEKAVIVIDEIPDESVNSDIYPVSDPAIDNELTMAVRDRTSEKSSTSSQFTATKSQLLEMIGVLTGQRIVWIVISIFVIATSGLWWLATPHSIEDCILHYAKPGLETQTVVEICEHKFPEKHAAAATPASDAPTSGVKAQAESSHGGWASAPLASTTTLTPPQPELPSGWTLVPTGTASSLGPTTSPENMTASDIYQENVKSVVVVESFNAKGKENAFGSGVVLPGDVVATNCHVVEHGSTFRVVSSEQLYPASLTYRSKKHDVCGLAVPGLGAPPVTFGTVKDLRVGESVYAIGAPEGLDLTLSEGIVSSLRSYNGGQYIQTTAAISHGSSGGGLFDQSGKLVGLTTFYIEGQSLNFALPVSWVEDATLPRPPPGVEWADRTRALPKPPVSFVLDAPGSNTPSPEPLPQSSLLKLANQGDAASQFSLGNKYYYGQGVSQSYIEAMKWYRLSAQHGNAGAQAELGFMYDKGLGEHQDYAQSVKWYRLAAQQGSSLSQYNLGYMYYVGNGLPQDYLEALKWFRLAADQNMADAQNNLGRMYFLGQGVPQNYANALKWYRLAVQQGDACGQFGLGQMYYFGKGMPQDYVEALKWFRLSAQQGNADAQSSLGLMYFEGTGVATNDAEAVKWFRRASQQGDAPSQGNLGVAYHYGFGVQQNSVAAYALFSLASGAGTSEDQRKSATNRDKLVASMTPRQIQAGQELTQQMQRNGVVKALDAYLSSSSLSSSRR